MTIEKLDIDKLEAGRELDALVAEKVLGWHHHPTWEAWYDFRGAWFDNPESTGDLLYLNELSADLRAAESVIVAVLNYLAQPGPRGRFSGGDVRLRRHVARRGTEDMGYGNWGCRFAKRYSSMPKMWTGAADDLPLAICRAALKVYLGPQD